MTTTIARRAGILAVATAAATTLTGCAGVLGAKMTYEDTVTTKITEIRVNGGSGDVVVNTGAVTETTVKRVVRGTANPGESYRTDGDALVLDTTCGPNCSVSYEITAPDNVAVQGRLRSGDLLLTGVGSTDLHLTSGDVTVREPTGPVKVRGTSGDIRVLDAKSSVTAQTTSGDIHVQNASGALDLKVTSGDINADLSAANSVTAQTSSGDVRVQVPAGSYRVSSHTGSGDEALVGITNDPAAKNAIDVRTGSGDATVTAR